MDIMDIKGFFFVTEDLKYNWYLNEMMH